MIRLRFYHILLCLLTLAILTPTEGIARSKKRAKTARSSKKRSKSASRKRGKTTKLSRQSLIQREALARLQFSQDSARILTGGTQLLPPPSHSKALWAEPSPILLQRGDTTLTDQSVADLYYRHRESGYEAQILHQVLEEAHQYTEKHAFSQALARIRLGLWYSPLNLTLVKKACDLALHLKDPHAHAYIWRLVTVLDIIARSGDGSSTQKAIRVMRKEDADLYESLWMDSEEHIVGKREEHSPEGKHFYIVSIQVGQSKSVKQRYFLIEENKAH